MHIFMLFFVDSLFTPIEALLHPKTIITNTPLLFQHFHQFHSLQKDLTPNPIMDSREV